MDLKQIKELMHEMGRTGICKLGLKQAGIELTLERKEAQEETPEEKTASEQKEENPMAGDIQKHRKGASVAAAEESKTEKENDNDLYVQSPMVGTFYQAPSPEEPAFIKVGDKINKDAIVCIVEAMKVMNEVKAGVDGVVAEVLIKNGHPVEFGSKLFRISKQ